MPDISGRPNESWETSDSQQVNRFHEKPGEIHSS